MGVHVDFEIEGEMADHVAAVTDGSGWYASVEEYVRDLIRQDQEQAPARFEAFKAELQRAFAQPDSDYAEFDAEAFLARMKQRERSCAA